MSAFTIRYLQPDANRIWYILDCGEHSLRRMLHGHSLVTGPEEDFVVIGNFRILPSLNILDYPYSSSNTSTDPVKIHPRVIGEVHRGHYYPMG